MTREQVQDLLAMVQATYPNYNPPSKTAAVNAWTMALEEYNADEVAMAFKSYMKTNTSGFAPTPGQLIDEMHTIKEPQELNEMEAWALVYKAICNSTYNSTMEFAKLPPLVQKAVGLPDNLREWAMTENLNHDVVSSNFIRNYKAVMKREEEIRKMPREVQRLIIDTAQAPYSAQIEAKRERAIKSLVKKENVLKAKIERSEGMPMPESIKRKMEEMRGKW